MLKVRQESLISSDEVELDAELPPVFKLEAAVDVGIRLFEKLAVFCNEDWPVIIGGGVVILFELVTDLGGKLVVRPNETVEIGNGLVVKVVAKPFVNCWVVVVDDDVDGNLFDVRVIELEIVDEKLVVESEFKLFISWFLVVVLGFREKCI